MRFSWSLMIASFRVQPLRPLFNRAVCVPNVCCFAPKLRMWYLRQIQRA